MRQESPLLSGLAGRLRRAGQKASTSLSSACSALPWSVRSAVNQNRLNRRARTGEFGPQDSEPLSRLLERRSCTGASPSADQSILADLINNFSRIGHSLFKFLNLKLLRALNLGCRSCKVCARLISNFLLRSFSRGEDSI